jgi:hypothetical protein
MLNIIVYASNGQQIATNLGQWNPQLDAASEDQWQIAVGDALRKKNIIQAGNFVSNPPTWGAESLVKYENSTAIPYIKQFSHHDCMSEDCHFQGLRDEREFC